MSDDVTKQLMRVTMNDGSCSSSADGTIGSGCDVVVGGGEEV